MAKRFRLQLFGSFGHFLFIVVYKFENDGDVIEILTSPNAKGPSWDWLKFVKSGSARAKIRQFFKREMKEDNVKTGRAMLEAEAKRRGYNLADILTEESFKKLSNRLVFSSVNEMMASVG